MGVAGNNELRASEYTRSNDRAMSVCWSEVFQRSPRLKKSHFQYWSHTYIDSVVLHPIILLQLGPLEDDKCAQYTARTRDARKLPSRETG